jgi:hypothetical protein
MLVESRISSSEIINEKEKGIRVTQVVTENVEGLNQPDLPLARENLDSTRLVSTFLCLYYFLSRQFRKNPRLPIFQEKPIYRRGNFRWAASYGQGPIALPPIIPNDAHLSEGDVFIRIDTASSASRLGVHLPHHTHPAWSGSRWPCWWTFVLLTAFSMCYLSARIWSRRGS